MYLPFSIQPSLRDAILFFITSVGFNPRLNSCRRDATPILETLVFPHETIVSQLISCFIAANLLKYFDMIADFSAMCSIFENPAASAGLPQKIVGQWDKLGQH